MDLKESRLTATDELYPENPLKPALAVKDLLKLIIGSLEDDIAVDIATIDLAGKSSIADFMVIASGRSRRQVGAIADHVVRKIKEKATHRPGIEGLPQSDWVLIDAGDVVVHIFRPEVRSFYNLEKMWSADLNTDASAN